MVVAAQSVDAAEIDVSGHDPPVGVGAEIVQGNRLLAALPVEEQRRLGAELAVVNLGVRDLIYDIDATITAVYFPLTCVLSVVATVDDDVAVEIATIGAEGLAGLPVFLGAAASPHRCFCQIPGQALRLEAAALRRLLDSDGALHQVLHRYTDAMMTFVGQNVACNRLHSADERTARWLAHTHDRVNADTFPITQEFLALMLGVRRATVSVNARILQRAGLIRYSRGRMTILDRDGLTAAACDCYGIIRHAFDQLN
jgi:CRP-like cAMP-binding protein